MNRLVCSTSDRIDTGALPEAGARSRSGLTRVLFIHTRELGFATASRSVVEFCAGHEGIDGVHVFVDMPRWLRLACALSPVDVGGLDFAGARQVLFWRTYLRRLLRPGGPLPLDRFDAVHLFTQQRGLIAEGVPIASGARAPAVVINADATLPAWDRVFPTTRALRSLDRRLEERAFQAAAATACWSRWVSDSAASDFGVKAERLFLYRPCVKTEAGAFARKGAAERGERGGPVRLVFVGNDWERKGGPRLVRWHQEHWAGETELHVCSSKAPADVSHKNVVYHGATPHEKLIREILPAMDVFVLPTRCDTFVIAAQEAQAAGLPVVSSRIAGVPEVVADGVSGVLCAADDDAAFIAAIDRMIKDRAWREHLSHGARAHTARNLDAQVWHTHLLDQIVNVAHGRRVAFAPDGVEL